MHTCFDTQTGTRHTFSLHVMAEAFSSAEATQGVGLTGRWYIGPYVCNEASADSCFIYLWYVKAMCSCVQTMVCYVCLALKGPAILDKFGMCADV